MATAPVVSYPFDPTGRSPNNRVPGEQLIVTAPGDRLFHFAMPKFAPFFEEGLTLKLRDLSNNVTPLVKGVDYYLSHKFMDASLATMHPIWGSITFLRRDIVGTVVIDYNTLGGIWTIDAQKIIEILMNTAINPRTTSWEEVVERPVDFPVIDHPWHLDDMVGQKEIIEVLTNFYNAYLASLDTEAGGGGGSGVLAKHVANRENPHGTTAGQVGAYTKAEVETILTNYLKTNGTAANSAQLGGKTLAQLMLDAAAATVANATKFNNKTYAEVLGEIALSKVAMATTADDSAKLEGKTYAQVMAAVKTTKVDTAGAADTAGALGGKTLPQIMLDVKATKVDTATTADNSNQLAGKTLAQIMDDVKVTKVDHAVDADNAANAGKLNDKTLPQIMLDVAASKVASAGTADNAGQLGGKSYAEVMLAAKSQKVDSSLSADDAAKLGGQTLAQIIATFTGTKVNSALNADDSGKLGGRTYDQVIEAAKTAQAESGATAANANKFNNKTYSEVMLDVKATKVDLALKADSAATADALGGKTLAQVMLDVKATKVDSAGNADTATNAGQLSGKTLAQIMLDVKAQKADTALKADEAEIAADARRAFGMTQTELAKALMADPSAQDSWVFDFSSLDAMSISPQVPANGGTADNKYYYALLGEYVIPVTNAVTPTYNTNADVTSSFMEVGIYITGDVHNARVHFGIDAPPASKSRLAFFSDRDLAAIGVSFGIRNVPSTIKTANGATTANINELYVRYDKTKKLRRVGVTQHLRNSFATVADADFKITDHTDVKLNDVVWSTTSSGAEAELVIIRKSVTDETTARTSADSAIVSDTQAALDQMSATIDSAISAPAA